MLFHLNLANDCYICIVLLLLFFLCSITGHFYFNNSKRHININITINISIEGLFLDIVGLITHQAEQTNYQTAFNLSARPDKYQLQLRPTIFKNKYSVSLYEYKFKLLWSLCVHFHITSMICNTHVVVLDFLCETKNKLLYTHTYAYEVEVLRCKGRSMEKRIWFCVFFIF